MSNAATDPAGPAPASAQDFRALMAEFPTGVAIVTTFDDAGRPWGMTCSSLCSVTLTPPTLLVCLRDDSPTLAAMLGRTTFTLNLLTHSARATAELFASGDPHRFTRVSWDTHPTCGGPHLTQDAHAIADCRVTHRQSIGDHMIVLGEVQGVVHKPTAEAAPLLYGRRTYAAWPR